MTDEYSEVWYEIEVCAEDDNDWFPSSPTYATEGQAEQAIKRSEYGQFDGYKTRVVEVTHTRKAIVKETAAK